MFVSIIGNVIIPTDFHSIIFQRGRAKNHQPVYQFMSYSAQMHMNPAFFFGHCGQRDPPLDTVLADFTA